MKIFEKSQKKDKNGRVIKKYKLLGITLFKKDKGKDFKRYSLFGVRFYRKGSKNTKNYSTDRIDIRSVSVVKDSFCLSPESICRIISNRDIKTVSFDIFDTLLIRPVLNPKDIFYLVASKVNEKFNINFVKLRWNAEDDLNNKNASIDDIYNHIKEKYGLSENIIAELINEELQCEYDMLTPRQDIKEIYDKALRLGKRIIAISDMYLPDNFLKKLLHEKGYKDIDKIYVSNKYKKRKDDGELYDVVIKNEHIQPHNLCHIGDNYQSDYQCAIKNKICAIYYPSIKDAVFSEESVYNKIWNANNLSEDPFARILMGFSITNAFSVYKHLPEKISVFDNLSYFVKLFLSPLLLYITFNIINNKEISHGYKKIFFASRDGYLPKMVYDIVARYRNVLPSEYLYSGRRAYFSREEADFLKYIEKHECEANYSLVDFINAFFSLDGISDKIIGNLSNDEKNSLFEKEKTVKILKNFEEDIKTYISNHRKNVSDYYKKVLADIDSERSVVFDCGYSGSISRALGNVSGIPWDKIYLWASDKNDAIDNRVGTKTYKIFGNVNSIPASLNLVLEELFSPCEGGCIGFKNGEAIKESIVFHDKMKNDITRIHEETRIYVEKFCKQFSKYIDNFILNDSNVIINSYSLMTTRFKSLSEYSLFKNICFPDPVFSHSPRSLSEKIVNTIQWNDPFDGTGFETNHNQIHAEYKNHKNNKIGIHIHLYNFYT